MAVDHTRFAMSKRLDQYKPTTKKQAPSPAAEAASGEIPGAGALHARVEQVLAMIRPAVQLDGGDVELVEITDEGVVKVRFLGACIGCPSSAMTLHTGIEKNLKAQIEEVTAVEAVES